MKRTSVKLKRRLEFVRMTVRQLTPSALGNVNGGGDDGDAANASILICPTKCCDGITGVSGTDP
jgi:hypothetical protein